MSYLKEVVGSRELLVNLALREIRGKYKRTVLGQLWSLANPLALMVIYTIVFSLILRVQPGPGDPSGLNVFALWLLAGLLPWLFFVNSVGLAMGSLVDNQNLIQKVYFPRIVLPFSIIVSQAYTWCIEMLVLIVALTIAGAVVWPWLPLIVLAMLLLAIFSSGLALLLAVANVYFRDTQYLFGLVFQLWFYSTPIIYPLSYVEQLSSSSEGIAGTNINILDLFRLNPMEGFVDIFRSMLYDNRAPAPSDFVICAIWAAVIFTIGLIVFQRKDGRLAELL